MKKLKTRLPLAAAAGLLIAGGGLSVIASPASSASPVAEHVTTTGHDTGNCGSSSPCATINYAISKASAGGTIKVAAGTYNQTVDINKPVSVVGVSASTTTIDGQGIDPSSNGYYGVVYVGNTGGAASVSGFTITNPVAYSYTGGEPMAVALADPNAGDQVSIINDTITEGNADSNAGQEFPIGIDGFANAATTSISADTISGFFQGSLLEDNGPATVKNSKFNNMISGTDTSTDPATVYPAEGLFFLADAGGAPLTGQIATSNTFSNYSGYGIAEDAGYTGGYVTPGCVANGSIETSLTSNTFTLLGGSTATGISLEANGTGNNLTGAVNSNKGSVTAPSNAMEVESVAIPATPDGTDCGPYSTSNGGGGTLDVTQNNDNITVKPAPPGATAATRSSTKTGTLHVPHFRHHHA